MTVNKERVELLAQALESGEYEQGICFLRAWSPLGDNGISFSYCAEGVAIRVALDNNQALRESWNNSWWNLSHPMPQILDWYGFDSHFIVIQTEGEGQPIAWANDLGVSFWDIAQALRATYLKDEG